MLLYIRKLYDWVLRWADSPFGPFVLFIISFTEASFFPIPPDVLLIALVLGKKANAFKFAFVCSIASIFGAIMGYAIGHYLWWDGGGYTQIAYFFFDHIPGFTQIRFQKIKSLYDLYGFIIIFTAGFTPIPFKIFTISSGAFNMPINLFIFASAISRSARFFIISFLIWKFGKKIKEVVDSYFNLFTILFVLILFGSYFVIRIFI